MQYHNLTKALQQMRSVVKIAFASSIAITALACAQTQQRTPILQASETIIVDAVAAEDSWQLAQWRPVDQLLLGENLQSEDFSGRYKLLWDSAAL